MCLLYKRKLFYFITLGISCRLLKERLNYHIFLKDLLWFSNLQKGLVFILPKIAY